MSFPKKEYQIMAEDGQSYSESLKQINGGLKGIQDLTKRVSMCSTKLLKMCLN